MVGEPSGWTAERQRSLQERLIDPWAQDEWLFPTALDAKRRRVYAYRFTCASAGLNVELKYALWRKFESRAGAPLRTHAEPDHLALLIGFLNQIAPSAPSLLVKPLEQWEVRLRSYLVASGQYRRGNRSYLLATQEYATRPIEDTRIRLLRYIYTTVADAYDGRAPTDKDLWDLRRMGHAVNPTRAGDALNFTLLAQPWLRDLAKAYMRYNKEIHSPDNCQQKLRALRYFSQFLAEREPTIQPRGIDRALIVAYIAYLGDRRVSNYSKYNLLTHLRTVLRSCAHELRMADITKEEIIFPHDAPLRERPLPREIPLEVLAQLRQRLATLPMPILRMVVITLECGLRINELCTLRMDSLCQDSKGQWSLQFYQSKLKQEHIIPLVNDEVVAAIQAQQRDIREQWDTACPYPFPSLRSPTKPFQQGTFSTLLNGWAIAQDIRDRTGRVYRFQSHQFRHSVGMRLINDDVPLDVISRLLGHRSITMTEVYARKRAETVRAELARAHQRNKTVDYAGQVVSGDPRADDPDVALVRQGLRGQVLPLGSCGRLQVLGPCDHENKCLSCNFWLTSRHDLPGLKRMDERIAGLLPRARAANNQTVVANLEHIHPSVQLRIAALEDSGPVGPADRADELNRLRAEALDAEAALAEAREARLMMAARQLEGRVADLRARIAVVEEAAHDR